MRYFVLALFHVFGGLNRQGQFGVRNTSRRDKNKEKNNYLRTRKSMRKVVKLLDSFVLVV